MKFRLPSKPNSGRSWVEIFLKEEVDKETAVKILDKLASFERFSLQQLMTVGHIKKVDGEIHEARVSVKSERFRFLGKIIGSDFQLVNVYHKKSQKLPLKELKTARFRISLLGL